MDEEALGDGMHISSCAAISNCHGLGTQKWSGHARPLT